MEEMALHLQRLRSKSSDRENTSEVLEAITRLSFVGAHCFGRDVDYVRVATPQPVLGIMPLAMALYMKDTGLIIPHVLPQLKCGPITTMPSETVAVNSVTRMVDFLYLVVTGTVVFILWISTTPRYMRFFNVCGSDDPATRALIIANEGFTRLESLGELGE
jgi:hypothetical protein